MSVDKFDEKYYFTRYPDVYAAVVKGIMKSGQDHYNQYGAAEGRWPNDFFDSLYYGTNNPDVVEAVKKQQFATVFDHFKQYGIKEVKAGSGFRAPSAEAEKLMKDFDGEAYLKANPKATGFTAETAIQHYLQTGRDEGVSAPRKGGSDVTQTHVLTPNQDDIHGTDGQDIIYATIDNSNVHTSLNAFDQIDGGKGDGDKLVVQLAADYRGGATIKNVETLQLGTNTNASFDYNVNAGHYEITGVKKIVLSQINEGETLTLQNLTRDDGKGDLPALEWNDDHAGVNGKAGTVAVNYRASAVSGDKDVQAVSLVRVRDGHLALASGIEKVTVNSDGDKGETNSLDGIDSAGSLKEVAIAGKANLGGGRKIGDQGLEIGKDPKNDNDEHTSFIAVGKDVTTVDASTAEGNVYVAFTDTATAKDVTFKGGKGNDQVIVNAGKVNLSGGEGDDTFIVKQTNNSSFMPGNTFQVKQVNRATSSGVALDGDDTIDGGAGTDTVQIDYAASALGGALGQVTVGPGQLRGLKGVDALDIRAAKSNILLSDEFVGSSDKGKVEIVTDRIVQKESAKTATDEIGSSHQIDLTLVQNTHGVKVTGGAGKESIVIGDSFSANNTLSGGDGQDALIVYNSASLDDWELKNVSGFDTINLVKDLNARTQNYKLTLSSEFLSNVVDPSAKAVGHSKNEANALRIVSANENAAGERISTEIAALDEKDTVEIEVDVSGLTTAKSINIDHLLNTGAKVLVVDKKTRDVLLDTKSATLSSGTGIFAGSKASATLPPQSPSVGTSPSSGKPSSGGTGTGPGQGVTFEANGTGDILVTTEKVRGGTLTPSGAKGLTAQKDTINLYGYAADDTYIEDRTEGDGDTVVLAVSNRVVTPTITGIENIDLTAFKGTLNIMATTGVRNVNLSGRDVTVAGVPAENVPGGSIFTPKPGLAGQNLTIQAGVGDNTAATLVLNGIKLGTLNVGSNEDDDIDQLFIRSEGDAENGFTLNTTFIGADDKITITGSQALTIKSVTATANSASIDATTLGKPVFTLNVTDFVENSGSTLNLANMTGLDVLRLSGKGSTATAGTSTISGIASALTIDLDTTPTAAGNYTNDTLALNGSWSGVEDKLTLKLNGKAGTVGGVTTGSGLETLTIESGGTSAHTIGALSATGATVNVGGNQSLTLGSVTAKAVDASGLKGAAYLTVSGAVGLTVLGSSQGDAVTATGGVTVTGGTGADVITLATTGTAVDVIRFTSVSDGSPAPNPVTPATLAVAATSGWDVIKNFNPANDKVQIAGDLLSAIDDVAPGGVSPGTPLTTALAGTATFTGNNEVVFISMPLSGSTSITTLFKALNEAGALNVFGGVPGAGTTPTTASRDGLIITLDAGSSGIFYLNDANEDGLLQVGEIQLLGLIMAPTAALTASNFVFSNDVI